MPEDRGDLKEIFRKIWIGFSFILLYTGTIPTLDIALIYIFFTVYIVKEI